MWFRRHSLQQSLSASHKLKFSFLFVSHFTDSQCVFLPACFGRNVISQDIGIWQQCWMCSLFEMEFSNLGFNQSTNVRIFTIKMPVSFPHKWTPVGPVDEKNKVEVRHQGSHQAPLPIVMSHRADFHNWVLASAFGKVKPAEVVNKGVSRGRKKTFCT